MIQREKKSKRIVVLLDEKDFETLNVLAFKERISVSGLVRHFIIRKIYDPLDSASKIERGV